MAKVDPQNPYAPQTPQSMVQIKKGGGLTQTGRNGVQVDTSGNVIGRSTIEAGNTSKDPFRSDLQTNFQGKYDAGSGPYNSYATDSDADVRQAQVLQNYLSASAAGLDRGVDSAAVRAQLDVIKARIGQKNSLGQSIAGNDAAELNAENDIKYNANNALASGVKNTRENYNGRGLLYSGLRQGGESSVRSGVAATMASGLANTKRDYGNSKDQAKAAYAAVGQAQEAAKVAAANQAFDTVSKNNVARQQAYQQLGEGLGRAAGTIYSSYNAKPGASTTPGASGFESGYAGTGSRDGYGGTQMSASNDDSYWRTA